MRTTVNPKLTAGRVRDGQLGSDDLMGLTGMFRVIGPTGARLLIMANDAEALVANGFEHVSVSLPNRCPNWPEMSFVKSLFWQPEETVVQFHPPEDCHVNNHPYCLHLWRDTTLGHRLPPPLAVGIKGLAMTSPADVGRALNEALAGIAN